MLRKGVQAGNQGWLQG